MIPKNISRDDILKAIVEIDENGIPSNRHSVKWSVNHLGSLYPPKYLISVANRKINGENWDPSKFSGGEETNDYLKSLGFEIVSSGSKFQELPIKSHSWSLLSDTVVVKELDKSSFLHNGTGVPHQLRPFFGLVEFTPSDSKEVILHHRRKEYHARFEMDKELKRMRLFWRADFADVLKNILPDWFDAFSQDRKNPFERPILRFKRVPHDDTEYELEFICPADIRLDVEAEISEEEPRSEGALKEFYGKRYERDTRNRAKAIEIHGMVCIICGFDFEEKYGIRGKGFIEIHHTKPLSSMENEQIIKPETDLVPVCSNCHRMIHRRRDEVLSVEQLRTIYHNIL